MATAVVHTLGKHLRASSLFIALPTISELMWRRKPKETKKIDVSSSSIDPPNREFIAAHPALPPHSSCERNAPANALLDMYETCPPDLDFAAVPTAGRPASPSNRPAPALLKTRLHPAPINALCSVEPTRPNEYAPPKGATSATTHPLFTRLDAPLPTTAPLANLTGPSILEHYRAEPPLLGMTAYLP